jgi:hypothetical protein
MPDGPDLTAELDAAEEADATPPICMSVAIQMDPLWRVDSIGNGYSGDLQRFAEDMIHYFVTNLERFGDPRGADLFVALSAQRGEEKAGHEYRSGHYVKEDAEPGPGTAENEP